jgi:hypothetical protein
VVQGRWLKYRGAAAGERYNLSESGSQEDHHTISLVGDFFPGGLLKYRIAS